MNAPPAQPPLPPVRPSRYTLAYLMATAVCCGGLIMAVEVLGSRVIGPFFGVSLFVWTALIAVTLVSLALGYAVGGVLSDRRGSPDELYGMILAAGVLVMLVPWMRADVLRLCVPLGLRTGALLSATVLFGPPLFLLGCVSPYLVTLAANELRHLGRTVGGFYALSTIGSVVGTVVTGFFLIGYMGINAIFHFSGVTLVLLALGYFVLFRRRWQLSIGLVAALFLPTHDMPVEFSRLQANGTEVRQVASHTGFYGQIKVVDYRFGRRHTRELIIDGLVQGGVDVAQGLSIYEYAYFLQWLPRALHPRGTTCLVIGLGAGVVPRWYESHDVVTDVVDIDPAVVAMATRYFGYHGRGAVAVEDARYFLTRIGKSYDYVVLDVFTGDTTPAHLLTREAMRLLRSRLTADGVVAVNIVGTLRGANFVTASVVATLASVFEQVEIYPTFDPAAAPSGTGNLVIIAYAGAPRRLDRSMWRDEPVHDLARAAVKAHIGRRFEFPAATPARVLTDDYNPVDVLDLPLKESVRREILEHTDWEILVRS